MRRLARWTLNALTALSLLICVATVVLWVRSFWAADTCCYGFYRNGVHALGRRESWSRGGMDATIP